MLNFASASDREIYDWLRGQQLDGVPGIYAYGPDDAEVRCAVIIGSHAKEVPAGIALLRHWMKLLGEGRVYDDVRFYLAIGNLPGTDMFYATDDPEQRKKLRFTPGGRDMNRMPPKEVDLLAGTSVEEKRASDLRRVFLPRKLDHVFDLHSTDQPSKAMGLAIAGNLKRTAEMFSHMPLPEILLNVADVQSTKGTKTTTLGGVLGATISVEIESGQTGSSEANTAAAACFEAWGIEISLLKGESMTPTQPAAVYQVVDSVMAPSTAYRVVDAKYLKQHCPVQAGEVLLRNDAGDEIKSPTDGLLIWGPDECQLTEVDVASEVWYIVRLYDNGN